MSDWGIVVPEAVTNLCTNPSFELGTTGWATGGTNVLSASNEQSWVGAYAGKCVCNTYPNNLGVYGITLPTPNVNYVWRAKIWVPTNFDNITDIRIAAYDVGGTTVSEHYWSAASGERDAWVYLEMVIAITADTTGSFVIRYNGSNPTVGRYIFFDAVQIEQASVASDYIDGDQPGCSWSGAPHASISSRSAVSRAGGVVEDLKDDYGFGVAEILGAGAAPVTVGVKGYSFLPGGAVSGIKVNPRQFSLIGTLKGSGADCDLHAARQALAKELAHNRYPQDDEGWQPVRIRYTGADVEKQIAAHYAGGLEAAIKLEDRIHEKAALRFVADDPMWYGLGESKGILSSSDTLAVRYIASRLRSTGRWDDLSVGAGGGMVCNIKVDTDNTLLACGNWATIDGVANTSRIARYTPSTDAWTALNKGATGSTIYAMAWGADGSLYVGGTFTSMDNGAGPVANTARIAKWDGSNWSPLGTGAANGTVRALAVGHDGTLYAGGNFTAMGGVANTDSIAAWNGTAWSSISSGITGNNIYTLAIGTNGGLWAGGDFTILDGVTVNRIAVYLPTNMKWYAAGGGASGGKVQIIACTPGKIYAGGSFTGMGAAAASEIAVFDGTSWQSLGAGVNNVVLALAEAPDGTMYVGGAFTEAGGVTNHYLAKWNGSSWSHVDIMLPVSVRFIGIANLISINNAHDLHVGFNGAGNASVPGTTTTATNDGSTVGYPRIVVKRVGGTSAILRIVRNETNGMTLYFNYSLLDGETLTIDLTPTQKSIVSSFFGDRMDAILANSDFGSFCLLPGDNDITCFVAESGSPTVTATMIWKDTYLSFD